MIRNDSVNDSKSKLCVHFHIGHNIDHPVSLSPAGLGLTPSISLSHLSSSQNWVPDRECLNCAACNETFSWKKRRHHCRSCGQVRPSFSFEPMWDDCTICRANVGRPYNRQSECGMTVQ